MSLIFDIGKFTSFNFIASMNTMFVVIYSVLLLRRTQQFQYILVMFERMIVELGWFFATFGSVIFIFLVCLRLLHDDFLIVK